MLGVGMKGWVAGTGWLLYKHQEGNLGLEVGDGRNGREQRVGEGNQQGKRGRGP